MKDKNITEGYLDEKLDQIKTGSVFETPEGYFEGLEQKIFVERGSEFLPKPSIRHTEGRMRYILQPLAYAASILVIIGLLWWMWKGTSANTSAIDSFIPDYVLEQYLESEIMEYDEDYLLQDLTEEDVQALSSNDGLRYESYIDAYFEDFEEFMY